MAKKVSNLRRLERAGILQSKHFSKKDQETVETLTEVEVRQMIAMRKKRGAAPRGKHHLRPNFFV
jgi:hypothetical protein